MEISKNFYRLSFKKFTDPMEQFFWIPVNPEKLSFSTGSENGNYNVLGIGPILQPRQPDLTKISFSSYFPGRIDHLTLTAEKFKKPEFYTAFFLNAMKNKEILLFIPQRQYETSDPYFIQENPGMKVIVTSFQSEERGGETGDFYYDLELTEYRDYLPLRIDVTEETDSETGATVVVAEQTRQTPQGQFYAGAKATVNGPYYYSSYGDEPHLEGNGRTCIVSRIITTDPTRPYPIHITTEAGGALGWVKQEALQVVSHS